MMLYKFRAWDFDERRMVSPTELTKRSSMLDHLDESLDPYNEMIGRFRSRRTYMQSVGRVDKKQKSIFQGDIVEFKYFESIHIGKVVFNTNTCGFEIWYKGREGTTHKMNFANIIDIEIIGNIYSNIELLECVNGNLV